MAGRKRQQPGDFVETPHTWRLWRNLHNSAAKFQFGTRRGHTTGTPYQDKNNRRIADNGKPDLGSAGCSLFKKSLT